MLVSSKTLKSLAEVSDRTGISHRSAAMIASATLQDLGVISETDKSKVIDKNAIVELDYVHEWIQILHH